MADIDFNCPHCGQNPGGRKEVAGRATDPPFCQKGFPTPGGITETPKNRRAPPGRPSAPAAPAARPSGDDEKGKTVRIELPPEFLAEPEKHMFKIKRIQH